MSLATRYPRAIVTGASRGLGWAFTQMLLDEGVEVWACSRNAEAIPKHPHLHACTLDLTNMASIATFLKRMLEECPEADILVNNAGYGVFSPFPQFPVNDITRQLDVMLTGPIRLCRAFYPSMLKRGSGAIVNVASLAADYPLPMMPLYNASKAGLSGFTRTLQLECKGSGVCVLDFQPGDYRTDFNKAMQRPEILEGVEGRVWEMLEKHLNHAPEPARAAQDLRRALSKGQSGLVRSGSFFQARLGPLFARACSSAMVLAFLRRYYRI